MTIPTTTTPNPRGFARLGKEELSRISRKGMVVLQALGLQRRITSEEAREMSKKAWVVRRARKGPGA